MCAPLWKVRPDQLKQICMREGILLIRDRKGKRNSSPPRAFLFEKAGMLCQRESVGRHAGVCEIDFCRQGRSARSQGVCSGSCFQIKNCDPSARDSALLRRERILTALDRGKKGRISQLCRQYISLKNNFGTMRAPCMGRPHGPGPGRGLFRLQYESALLVHFVQTIQIALAVALFVKRYLAGQAVKILEISMQILRNGL